MGARSRLTEAERILDELRSSRQSGMDPTALERGTPATKDPAVRTSMAAVAWLWSVFALCYVLIPSGIWAVTGDLSGLAAAPAFFLAFVAASVVTAFLILLQRPVLARGRDPVWAAMLGGLAAWAFGLTVISGFKAIGEYSAAALLVFVLQNCLEMGLLGAMWASFTRRPAVAFTLGALFQLFILGIASVLMGG